MKKNTKKQIPKVRLPKYFPGGTHEEGHEGSADQPAGSENFYNQGRTKKINNGQYAQMAMAAANTGAQLYANRSLTGDEKSTANAGAINSGVDSIAGSVTPWYQYAKGASDMGRGMIKRDDAGVPIDSKNKQLDAVMKPQHQMAIDDATKGNYGLAVSEMLLPGIGYESRSNALGLGKGINKLFGSDNSTNYKFAMGGMQYANGGTGQINAEVEGGGYGQDGENAVAPGGQFTQFNGPTHAQGGIQTDMAPGTRIFSDKIKIGNKTVAELNKPNNTNREDKLAAKGNLDPKTATSLALTKMAKMKNSDMLFNMQEQIKKDKVAAYAKKMGVQLPSMDNEQAEPQGMSEASEGEVVTAKYGGMYAKGGIHINPANKGKFTASAQHAGMGTQEFARHVLANKEDYSSTQVKRANFAHNAAGWKHKMGGIQQYEMGGESEYNMLGNPDEPRPLNQKNAKVKAAIARNLNENPLVKDYNYRLQVDNKKGDRLFATGTDGKENEVFFQDLKTGKYNPAYNDTVRAAIKIKMEQDALNSVQKHALGGVQLPYYNTNNDGKPIYAMGGDYPAMTNLYHNFKGHVPMYAMGGFNDDPPINVQGLTKPQYEQAQRDSSVIYKSGLKQGPNYQFPGFTESSMREGSRINPRSPFIKTNTGQQYGSENGSNMMNNESSNFNNFKPTMVPWKEYVPTKSTEVNNKNVEHPKYDTFVPGIQKSKQPVIIEQYSKGGQMPKYVNGGPYTDPSETDMQEQADRNAYYDSLNRRINNTNVNQNSLNLAPNTWNWNASVTAPTVNQANTQKVIPTNETGVMNLNQSSSRELNPNSKNFDWGNLALQGANFLGQNAGNIYDLTRKNEPLETYERATAKYVTPDFRDANQKYLWAKTALANISAGNAGTTLSNIQQAHVNNVMNRAQIQQAADNTNAEIGNKNAQFNAEIARSEAIARAANAAAKQNVESNVWHNFATNIGKMTKSNKEDAMAQKELAMFQWRYKNEPGFKEQVDNFSTKKSKIATT